MSLKDTIAIDERPREKAMSKGLRELKPSELIATIIGSGSRGENVVQLCERILSDHDNKLYKIARRSVSELVKMYRGVGQVKALQILAAIEFARKYQGEQFDQDAQIRTSDDAYRCLKPLIADLPHEEIWILILNRSKCVTDKVKISSGGTASTIADVKMILREAIEHLADSIILAHNHPSDTLKPSRQDDELTAKVKKGCDAVGIPLLDHVIVCRAGRYFSYLDHGLI